MSDDLKCLHCGRSGHLAESCELPVLPDNSVLGPATSPAPNSQPAEEQMTDPENQPNQFGVKFLMHGPKFAFRVGAQQFTLDYEPTEPGEFEFMRYMLIHAFSTFTHDVKTAQAVRSKLGAGAEDETRKLHSLLGAALGALRYHTEQTRPIQRTQETIDAIERELASIVGKEGA